MRALNNPEFDQGLDEVVAVLAVYLSLPMLEDAYVMEDVLSARPSRERKLLLYLRVAVRQIVVEKGNDHRYLITNIST